MENWTHAVGGWKQACGWSTPCKVPPQSVGDTELVSCLQEKAEVFNEHFCRQCSMSPSAVFPSCPDLPKFTSNPGFQFSQVSSLDIALLLRSLPSGKSAGPDITNELLKLSAPAVSESLAAIVNDSLTLGILPRSWKESIVSPVLKAGKDATKPVSYRPISLLSNVSKVVEKVVHSQLIRHCLDNRIIPDEQFGFLRGRSAELQLLSNLEVWHESLDKRNHVHCVLLDAAKAFDRVDHTALLSMLQSIGLDHVSLRWFFSYLSGRHIRTKVSNHLSSPSTITSGVPQGSVLGHLLFLIYYKNIPSVASALTALFADDMLLFHPTCQGFKSSPCCPLQADLDALSSWAIDLNISFNALKSVDFCLGHHPSPDLLQVDGVVIPRRTETRHLGVVLSVDLQWNSHIDHLLSVTAGPVYLCQKLVYQHRLPSLAIRRFYIAFVRPRLEYCNAAWCGLTRIQALRLEKVQVRVARAIVRCPGGSRSQVLQDAGLPTLLWRRREHCLGLLWKLVNGIGPPALLNVLPATAASRSSSVLRSSHSLQFPLCLSSRRKSSFLCYTIPIWNKLSLSVISCSSVSSFQCSLRKAFADDKFTYRLTWVLVLFFFIVKLSFFLSFFFLSFCLSFILFPLCLLRRVPWLAPSYWTILKQIVSINK